MQTVFPHKKKPRRVGYISILSQAAILIYQITSLDVLSYRQLYGYVNAI